MAQTTPLEQLGQGLAAMGLELPQAAQEQLLAYVALLYKWNKTFSLTAMREQEKAISHHLLDSLAILPYVPAGRLLDVGSGGGMPGIPLAIVRPELQVTLIDSNSKKTAFLQQAAIELGLKNVVVQTGRVELFHPAIGFSAITSRAFAELADFVGLSAHLLAADGVWLAMKGIWPHDEIARLPLKTGCAGCAVTEVHGLKVPGVDGERHLVILKKNDAEKAGEN